MCSGLSGAKSKAMPMVVVGEVVCIVWDYCGGLILRFLASGASFDCGRFTETADQALTT